MAGGNITRELREYRRSFIREHYLEHGAHWCALRLGIKPASVTKTAQKIGVKAFDRKEWPAEKKQFIRENLDLSNETLAAKVGEDIKRVRVLANKMRRAKRKDLISNYLSRKP